MTLSPHIRLRQKILLSIPGLLLFYIIFVCCWCLFGAKPVYRCLAFRFWKRQIGIKKVSMGQGQCSFTREELDEYEELTYLSRSEILRAYKKFLQMEPIKVAQNRHAKIPWWVTTEVSYAIDNFFIKTRLMKWGSHIDESYHLTLTFVTKLHLELKQLTIEL